MWSMTGGYPKIVGIDARMFLPMPLLLIVQSPLLWFCEVVLLAASYILAKKGYTIELYYLSFRRKLAGPSLAPFPMSYIQRHDESY